MSSMNSTTAIMPMEQTCRFFNLSYELKEHIYSYCYLPPYHSSNDRPTSVNHDQQSLDSACSKASSLTKGGGTNTKCCSPSHLSMNSVCRQMRREYFPFFAARHTLNMTNPNTFEHACLTPDPVLRHTIRHLYISWPVSPSICRCWLPKSGGKQKHHYISDSLDLEGDLQNLLKLCQTTDILDNLQTLRFDLPLPCDPKSAAFHQHRVLFEYIVLLLENTSQKYFEIQPKWDKGNGSHLQVMIWRVPEALFGRLPSGALKAYWDCRACTRRSGIFGHDHANHWDTPEEVVEATEKGKVFYPIEELADCHYDSSRNWKVVFHPAGGGTDWNCAMHVLRESKSLFPATADEGKLSLIQALETDFEDDTC